MTEIGLDSEIGQLGRIIEGALFAAGEAVSIERLLSLFEEDEKPSTAAVVSALHHLQMQCTGRGYELVEVASGWRFQVRADLATWVNRLWEEKPQRYSRAVLETIALIAYRQPITRGDIEEVRGVSVSTQIIKTLAEREWIKIIGHRDVPGRPALYATTRQFLDYFGLKSLEELPSLSELKDVDGFADSLLERTSATDTSQENERQDGGDFEAADTPSLAALPDSAPKEGEANQSMQPPIDGSGNNER